MITQEIFRKEDFSTIVRSALIKVYLKPDYGLVRNQLNNDLNYVYGFVIEEKINPQILFLKPRSWDDQIIQNIIDGDLIKRTDETEFFVFYNDIERIFVSGY